MFRGQRSNWVPATERVSEREHEWQNKNRMNHTETVAQPFIRFRIRTVHIPFDYRHSCRCVWVLLVASSLKSDWHRLLVCVCVRTADFGVLVHFSIDMLSEYFFRCVLYMCFYDKRHFSHFSPASATKRSSSPCLHFVGLWCMRHTYTDGVLCVISFYVHFLNKDMVDGESLLLLPLLALSIVFRFRLNDSPMIQLH